MPALSFSNLRNMLQLKTVITRFRYPYSLPEEIGMDLGLCLSNTLSFSRLLALLTYSAKPENIHKFMLKDEVLDTFTHAFKAEHFTDRSLFFYYFKQGWVEFEATFDAENKLRRLRLLCHECSDDEGVEIPIH